jgi:alkylation response protein AidB-like acyl-CoA dehydrogenase
VPDGFRKRRAAVSSAFWGADGPEPVTIVDGKLRGEKLYASGADVLDHAVISARNEKEEMVLLVVAAERLQGRLYPDEWSMTGMRATASGRCDLNGFELWPEDRLGQPEDYHREPHFQGGV